MNKDKYNCKLIYCSYNDMTFDNMFFRNYFDNIVINMCVCIYIYIYIHIYIYMYIYIHTHTHTFITILSK